MRAKDFQGNERMNLLMNKRNKINNRAKRKKNEIAGEADSRKLRKVGRKETMHKG